MAHSTHGDSRRLHMPKRRGVVPTAVPLATWDYAGRLVNSGGGFIPRPYQQGMPYPLTGKTVDIGLAFARHQFSVQRSTGRYYGPLDQLDPNNHSRLFQGPGIY